MGWRCSANNKRQAGKVAKAVAFLPRVLARSISIPGAKAIPRFDPASGSRVDIGHGPRFSRPTSVTMSLTPAEFRGEFADVIVGNPANLNPTNNVGKSLFGASGEVAYHVPLGPILGGNWEAVPFYRYTYQNFQTGGFAGTDLNFPTGSGRMQLHDVGVAIYPTPEGTPAVNGIGFPFRSRMTKAFPFVTLGNCCR
jgi:hypothetical protein